MPKRVDKNQASIVADLRAYGAAVLDLHTVGKGCPDILVYYENKYFLFEIKSEHGKLTPSEEQFQRSWPGPVYTIRSSMDAIETIREFLEDW